MWRLFSDPICVPSRNAANDGVLASSITMRGTNRRKPKLPYENANGDKQQRGVAIYRNINQISVLMMNGDGQQ